MRTTGPGRKTSRILAPLAGCLIPVSVAFATADAQITPVPAGTAPAVTPESLPKPKPKVDPKAKPKADPKAKPVKAETVEARLEQLEETNQQLLNMVRELARQNEALASQVGGAQQPGAPLDRSLEGGVDSIENPVPVPPDPSLPPAAAPADYFPQAPALGAAPPPSQPPGMDRSLEGGVDSIENPVPGDKSSWKDGKVKIGPGVMLESEDGEYQLQFHNQTQVETRIYQQGAMNPGASNFDIPRERIIMNGRMTKNLEFDASIEASYGTINVLNAFLNFKAGGSDQFMIKAGRFKVPYLYEYYAISNVDMLTPERSLFGINYGFNRMVGAQIWGSIFDKRMDYAVGIFDGPRNQSVDYNNSKDVIAYLNFKPFLKGDVPWLKNLNIGSSVDAGSQDNPVVPRGFKTSVSQGTNVLLDTVSPNWLVFNPTVYEQGWRSLGSLHAAYFYKQFSFIGEWAGGFTTYGYVNKTNNPNVPINSYYAEAGYFLTGEEVERRTQVRPKHNFSLKPGKFGLGAWEMVGRYSTLSLGKEVFTNNLVDQSKWANSAYATDVGFNWYWNPYLKVYMFWQHSEFDNPVVYNTVTNAKQINSDMFWLRFQLYF